MGMGILTELAEPPRMRMVETVDRVQVGHAVMVNEPPANVIDQKKDDPQVSVAIWRQVAVPHVGGVQRTDPQSVT